MKTLYTLILCLISQLLYSQYYSDEQIKRSGLSSWKSEPNQAYAGIYHFGYSEGECELRIFVSDTLVAAQASCFTGDEKTGLKDTILNFKEVRIIGNKFFSDRTNGEFLVLKQGTSVHSGLLVDEPWTYRFYRGGEFGSLIPGDGVYLNGTYPFCSTEVLSEKDLKKYSKDELALMRNEIFARYGMRFQSGGKMDNHFRATDWYRPHYDKVDQWLTIIELRNIELIRKIESE